MPASIISQSLDGFYAGDKDGFITKYSYVEDVISRMPKYSSFDASSAAEMASMSLAAALVCAELVHDIAREYGSLEVMTDAEEADSYFRSSQTSAAMKKVDSQRDEEFVVLRKKLSAAKCLADLLKREYDVLVKQHHLCKDLIKGVQSVSTADSGGSGLDDNL